jgi:hypothetical protein
VHLPTTKTESLNIALFLVQTESAASVINGKTAMLELA